MNPYTITLYKRQYLQPIRDLLFHSHLVHTHLDWHETDQWLDTQRVPMRLVWYKGRLMGVLATSMPLNGACWIRLAAVAERADPAALLRMLWGDLSQELRVMGIRLVALLAVRGWITDYASVFGFQYQEDIITMSRSGTELPDLGSTRLVIRVAEWSDLETMDRVDQAAFDPPWQLTLDELRQAYRISSSCTVALLDNVMVGYQLSTLYFDGAHLARLAVASSSQGVGIGGHLLADGLRRYFKRGIYTMTLNTQASNQRSRRLYTRFGFQPNGYNLPYWTTNL